MESRGGGKWVVCVRAVGSLIVLAYALLGAVSWVRLTAPGKFPCSSKI